MPLLRTLLLMLIFVAATTAAGNDRPPGHLKVIDFDDEIVEGMNKRPLDSLSQLSEKEKSRRKSHLYRKRGGFRTETALSLQQLRFAQ